VPGPPPGKAGARRKDYRPPRHHAGLSGVCGVRRRRNHARRCGVSSGVSTGFRPRRNHARRIGVSTGFRRRRNHARRCGVSSGVSTGLRRRGNHARRFGISSRFRRRALNMSITLRSRRNKLHTNQFPARADTPALSDVTLRRPQSSGMRLVRLGPSRLSIGWPSPRSSPRPVEDDHEEDQLFSKGCRTYLIVLCYEISGLLGESHEDRYPLCIGRTRDSRAGLRDYRHSNGAGRAATSALSAHTIRVCPNRHRCHRTCAVRHRVLEPALQRASWATW
jgi:hypothetical protein